MNAPQTDIRHQVSAEEWALRVDLAACYRLVALFGWDDLVFTHISARVPGPEHHFLINPYGFAWTRRVTEDNVDLNRNFVDHDKPYPRNDGYLAIADAVLPQEWSEASKAETERLFAAYAQKHGAFGLQ